MQEQVFCQDLWPHGHPHGNSLFLKDYAQWKGSMPEQFMEDCLMGRTPGWDREGVWGGKRGDEVLWTELNLHSLFTAWRGSAKIEDSRAKLSLGRRLGEDVYSIFLNYFSLSKFVINWQPNELFPWTELVSLVLVMVEQPSCLYPNP